MISVNQDWKNIQQLDIRPQSNVRLSFYRAKIVIVSNIPTVQEEIYAVIDKNDINSFTQQQSGSISNDILPTNEIHFECFMNNGRPFDFDENSKVKVEYGYEISKDNWEYITMGYFHIIEKKIPQNGFLAKYDLRIGAWWSYTITSLSPFEIKLNGIGSPDLIYTYGTYRNGPADLYQNFYSNTLRDMLQISEGGSDVNFPISSISKCLSWLEMGRQLAIVKGRTLCYSTANTTTTMRLNKLQSESDYVIPKKWCFNYPEKTIYDKYNIINIVMYYQSPQFNNYDEFTFTSTRTDQTFRVENGKYDHAHWTIGSGEASSNVWGNRFTLYGSARTQEVKLYFYETKSKQVEIYNDGSETEFSKLLTVDTELCHSSSITEPDKKNMIDLIIYGNNKNVGYEVDCRIDPRVQLFDVIKIQRKDNTMITGYVDNIKIEYNGCFKGSISIRLEEEQKPEAFINRKTIDVADFNDGKECVIENMSSLSVFLNMQTTVANGMIWKRRNRQTLEVIDEFEVPCGRVAIGQKTDPDTKEVLGKYLGVYEHTTGSQYRLLEPNPISTEFNSGNEIWTITLKSGYSLHFSRSGYERYLLDNFSGYIDYR